MEQWLRLAVIVVILLSFLRRIFKAGAQGKPPSPFVRPTGRKNDFRDIPPPPENPELG